MSLSARIAASAVVLCLLGAAVGDATWSFFRTSGANPGDTFAAGTVMLDNNDAGATTVSLFRARPGEASTGCVKYTYTGSLPATVKLYGTVTGALAPYLTSTVTRGTQSSATFPSCTGFTPDSRNYSGFGAGVLYAGTVAGMESDYATGLDDPDNATGAAETWTSGESHVLQFVVTMGPSVAAKGLSASLTIYAEARNL
jgi:hypothetical protein